MKDVRIAKVVFFKDSKEFNGSFDGNLTDHLSQACLYNEEENDSDIIDEFDEDYQEQAEIWKVKITVETI